MMTDAEREFLELIRSSINRGSSGPGKPLPENDVCAIISMAKGQKVAPLVYDRLKSAGCIGSITADKRTELKDYVLESAIRQITQTNEFLTLLLHAQERGLDPIVIKGIICRELYPVPCLRASVDEDLLILPEEIEKYHEFFLSEGLFADEAGLSADERRCAHELSYHKENSPTYIELHTSPFDPGSTIFSELNDLFDGLYGRTVRVQIEDVSVRTLAPTDHVLYLILHAYKHFLHSGVGIRPICDIGLYAETYAAQIDWGVVRRDLESVHAFYFARALFRILQIHLFPDGIFFSYICKWDLSEVDVDALLADCLESGVHGASSLSRLHSSRMTLHAAENREGNRKGRYAHAVLRTALPPVRKMEDRYTYLKRSPFLLPVAWMQRAAHYLVETGKKENEFEADNNAAVSIRLGKERIGLLRQYRIIE